MLQDVHPGRHYNDDYDFKKPKADLSNMRQNPPGHAHDKYELYEWPGGFTEFADGETYARVRLEQQLSPRHIAQATSNRRELSPGYTLSLTNHPREDQNQDYLILAVHYEFHENPQVSEGAGGTGSQQKFSLALQPKSVPYRPQRKTPKPRTHGPQTAVVVGPAGEEIWVDQYGRVKVQFHWDREGKMDENSSCWVRVSTAWAGSNFGAVFTPRIGMEVIIDFLNGDPDYPILTGCVYNAANMPPWGLPDNATQSGWLTRSSKGGAPGAGQKNGAGDANAIRFEDKAGQEQLWFHAQKDQLTEVEHDEDKWVGNDRRKTVDGNETNVIHKNRTETVGINESVTIGANRSVTIGGSKTETVAAAKAETIGAAKALTIGAAYQVTVGAAMNETIGAAKFTEVGAACAEVVGLGKSMSVGKTFALDAGDAVTVQTGSSVLSMKKDGTVDLGAKQIKLHTSGGYILIKDSGSIEISGTEITIKTAGGQVHIDTAGVIKAAGTDVTMTAGAGKVNVDPGGIVDIKGPMVKINT
jgi:type VI secretion system secreted protein VgrG